MAHSVETRLPFLDYRLVELLASYPLSQKMNMGWTKYVLRNAMKGVLPESIRLRKSKLGFSIPFNDWCKAGLWSRMQHAFNEPRFISTYINQYNLLDSIYMQKKRVSFSLHTPELLFKFFILELWGRKFILKTK